MSFVIAPSLIKAILNHTQRENLIRPIQNSIVVKLRSSPFHPNFYIFLWKKYLSILQWCIDYCHHYFQMYLICSIDWDCTNYDGYH